MSDLRAAIERAKRAMRGESNDAEYDALFALVKLLETRTKYTLAEIRNGTGFEKNARFIQVEP